MTICKISDCKKNATYGPSALELGGSYVYRVPGFLDDPVKALCKKRAVRDKEKRETHTYFVLTERGEQVAQLAASVVRERLAWVRAGHLPCGDARPWKTYVTVEKDAALRKFYGAEENGNAAA